MGGQAELREQISCGNLPRLSREAGSWQHGAPTAGVTAKGQLLHPDFLSIVRCGTCLHPGDSSCRGIGAGEPPAAGGTLGFELIKPSAAPAPRPMESLSSVRGAW